MRWVTGLLLVVAAVLKAAELINEPAVTLANPLGRFFVPIQVGLELGLGLFVLSGLYWAKLRWLLPVLFTAFAGYSFYMALDGADSCGCFGPLRVHPWWLFFLDMAIVGGLALSLIREGIKLRTSSELSEGQTEVFFAGQRSVVITVLGLSVIATALLLRYLDNRTAMAGETLEEAGGLFILEPEKWVGQKLPIAAHIDINLSSGEWTAVLHRHDCPACQEAVPRYERLAETGSNVALVEVPPYGDASLHESICRQARLRNDREWFVQTPLEIHLQDGIVTSAKVHGH
jgi:hypothetical protein